MWRIAWRMDAYAGPYIPGVDVAVSRSGSRLVVAPIRQSGLQCPLVRGLELDARGRCDYHQEAHTLRSRENLRQSALELELELDPIERRDFDQFTFSQFKSCNTLSEPIESTSKCIT